jgi:hypothetical protein
MFPKYDANGPYLENAANELREAGLTPDPDYLVASSGQHRIPTGHPIIKEVRLHRRTQAWHADITKLADGYEGHFPVFEKSPALTKLGEREDVSLLTDGGNPYQVRLRSQESLNEFVKIAQSL